VGGPGSPPSVGPSTGTLFCPRTNGEKFGGGKRKLRTKKVAYSGFTICVLFEHKPATGRDPSLRYGVEESLIKKKPLGKISYILFIKFKDVWSINILGSKGTAC